jgi:hypothetical protein
LTGARANITLEIILHISGELEHSLMKNMAKHLRLGITGITRDKF